MISDLLIFDFLIWAVGASNPISFGSRLYATKPVPISFRILHKAKAQIITGLFTSILQPNVIKVRIKKS